MAQMLVEGGEPGRNLPRAVERIREASGAGCAVVVLPECLDIGWTHPSARSLARTIPGPHSETLSRAALEAGIYVVAGLTERYKDRLYNTAVLISPEGHIRLKHRKINVLDIAQDLYDIGDSLSVARTGIGTIGVSICADNFPSSLVFGHSLARMGAQLLLSPSAWAVDLDHDNRKDPYGGMWRDAYSELARLYDMTVVGVSNVGPIEAGVWAGRKCIGCSMAIGPGGKLLAQASYGETADVLEIVEVELAEPTVKGTNIAASLASKGYKGP
jgi:predicted amidohydrolase